ncbi:MAG: AAA family ATPase [Anaerolineae bacterium]|nr:AAA family ATPase [Anaerolineae bacterium]
MSLWNQVIGHEWAVELLSGAITHERVGHAYLITGPDQIGKTTLARTFAQALNCQHEIVAERPCGTCRSCKLIGQDKHLDVKIVTPEVSGRGKMSLKIDQIRALQQDLNLSAYEGRYKVAILKRFDTATEGAANAFLKTLEEPPNNVILLLTAKDPDTIMATINSRCRNIGLRPLSTNLIESSLQSRWHIDGAQSELLAHLADGRLGWAVNASKDNTILTERDTHLEALYEAIAHNRVKRFDIADKLSRKAEDLPYVLETWLSWWRDLNILAQNTQGKQITLSDVISNIDQREKLQTYAHSWTVEQALASLKQTNLALWQLQRNANTRLALENLLLTYPLPQ